MLYFGADINITVGEDLRNLLMGGRFPHTIIIDGGAPAERLKLARGLAQALVCEGEGERPCGSCSHCIKAADFSHPDISVFNETTKSGFFAKDVAKEMVAKAPVIPNEAGVKVFILNALKDIPVDCQNVLLKILEEPPAYMRFIILCPGKAGVLPTVLSRAQTFELGDPPPQADDETVAQAVKIAAAAVSDSEFDIIEATAFLDADKSKKKIRAVLPALEMIYIEAMKVKSTGVASSSYDGCANILAGKMSLAGLICAREKLSELYTASERAANYNLTITRICTALRSARNVR